MILAKTQRMRSTEPTQPAHTAEEHLELNADQQAALTTVLNAINASRHETVLIHGITGSGKTEVYIQAIQEVVSFGRQAIVLVPEISLTPQTESRFRARFGRVAVLHSHLSDAERHWHWEQIADGQVPVIVGARSAVFAPTPHLGLIVIDEEHESSFKQETAPRYRTRDVAQQRAAAEGIPLVLGSATPSLESWQRAIDGEYRLVEMPRRVFDRPLPQVATIDLRVEREDRQSRGALSRPLLMAMERALQDGGQVILLLNRRGFATHVQCPACGHALNCPHCEIALTHHRHAQLLICHYCDFQLAEPNRCPHCGFDGLRFSGRGTQKLEMEVRARFPGFECLRMDTDSMQRPGSHQEALRRFREGEVRILLGTQMIAKGLDFPDVTLVGVINADTALHLPDFRAAERTFQLVTQVAGRTGRGPRGGRVLVQTYEPEHSAIRAAVRHDYAMFAAEELPIRRTHGYPPFGMMVRLVVRGPEENLTREVAAELGRYLREAKETASKAAAPAAELRLLGPAPAPFPRLHGKYRFVVQLLAAEEEPLRAAVRTAVDRLKLPDDVLVSIDVDPVDMM
ncbi:MAG: primosomal protein N' [Planctomycetia bacterium]|nr:primosomal protein N' [Planctomycetia bacterium]